MLYTVNVITGPTGTPISLSEAKAQLSIPDSITDQDTFITSLIHTGTGIVEDYTNRKLFTQTLELVLGYFPGPFFELPWAAPLVSVTSIKYKDSDGVETTISTDVYSVETSSRPGVVALKPNQSWPSASLWPKDAIRIRYVVGQAAADIPAILKHAVKLCVASLYENRELTTLPKQLQDMLYSHRIHTPLSIVRGL